MVCCLVYQVQHPLCQRDQVFYLGEPGIASLSVHYEDRRSLSHQHLAGKLLLEPNTHIQQNLCKTATLKKTKN